MCSNHPQLVSTQSHILAAKAVSNILKTSLGPKGMDKVRVLLCVCVWGGGGGGRDMCLYAIIDALYGEAGYFGMYE